VRRKLHTYAPFGTLIVCLRTCEGPLALPLVIWQDWKHTTV